ncbi:PX domain-containing protein [Fulvia fulva]|uniref:Endosomal/vacuolar adapter protein YPT35 n=1 Tax=Passalora fulva TaxID=5499 RepID=A0A9Q8P6K8_PASFU|nr:PX domain-containing protein [Fulvia fulva]KAK4629703.1 PX domain-containing protein [Fulvia fulva]KAK4630347.1 PX domain-containing protein [Fulvia fulva]UJO15061.1 PX domain-containing protein [Fulvia fulva]WPV12627.1 PX domain-containing protein [Fulvia fulva]WPV27468.1 PX domain-containing protein [Fulvia fulva]
MGSGVEISPGAEHQQPVATAGEHVDEYASAHSSAPDTTPPARSTSTSTKRVTDAPPFWSSNARHSRSISTASYHSLNQTRPPAIVLEDHSDDGHLQAQSCWARAVSIDEYVVVSGPTGIGAYVVWHCTVSTLKGGDLSIRKRYSEFDRLREDLVRAFRHAEAMIPELPRKSVVSRFRPKFLDQRRDGLSHFLNCVLLNPEFASSPILKDFIFY